jgi:hypothetical protein
MRHAARKQKRINDVGGADTPTLGHDIDSGYPDHPQQQGTLEAPGLGVGVEHPAGDAFAVLGVGAEAISLPDESEGVLEWMLGAITLSLLLSLQCNRSMSSRCHAERHKSWLDMDNGRFG